MKKLLLTGLLIYIIAFRGFSQNCELWCVQNIEFNNTSDTLFVSIFNGNPDTNFVNYPIIHLVAANGDTIGISPVLFFGHPGQDTLTYWVHSTYFDSVPENFSCTVILEGTIWNDSLINITCNLPYPCLATSNDDLTVSKSDIAIFPNPAQDYFRIEFAKKITHLNLYSITGQAVKMPVLNKENTIIVNTENLSDGIYVVIAETDEGCYTKKISIIK